MRHPVQYVLSPENLDYVTIIRQEKQKHYIDEHGKRCWGKGGNIRHEEIEVVSE